MSIAKFHLIFSFSIFSLTLFAQDTTSTFQKPIVRNEFGVNATMLLKQVFNLSNNTFVMLPYDITYKRIVQTTAFRFGLGATMDYSKNSTTTSSSGVIPGPNDGTPTYHHAYGIYFRGGWEKRFPLGKKILAYGGLDVAAHYSTSSAQTATVYNNLPNSYSFQKSRTSSNTIEFGGGPVAGIQYYITNRLSIFTEIPLYALYSIEKDKDTEFSNVLQFSNVYQSQSSSSSSNISGMKFSITLPVTLYLALKF